MLHDDPEETARLEASLAKDDALRHENFSGLDLDSDGEGEADAAAKNTVEYLSGASVLSSRRGSIAAARAARRAASAANAPLRVTVDMQGDAPPPLWGLVSGALTPSSGAYLAKLGLVSPDAGGTSGVVGTDSREAMKAANAAEVVVYEHREPPEGSGAPTGPSSAGTGALPAATAAVASPESPGAPDVQQPAFFSVVARSELMRRIRAAIAEEEAAGSRLFGESARALTGWDVHYIDPAAASVQPGFELRRGCLLVHMAPLRAVITQRMCFIAPEAGADGELQPLLRMLAARAAAVTGTAASTLPLPLVALTAVLSVCRAELAADARAAAGALARVTAKLARNRSSEETKQEYISQAEDELGEFIDRADSVLAAVAAFAAAEAAHRRDTRRGARARLGAVHEVAAVFGMRVKALQGEVAALADELGQRKKLFALRLARHRNAILQTGLLLPLLGCIFGFCSMVSGWYGMNLGNGTCGPDGCNDFSPLFDPVNYFASQHGYPNFVGATAGSSLAVFLAGSAAWLYIRKLM